MKNLMSAFIFLLWTTYLSGQCSYDRHNPGSNSAWKTCTTAQSPNPIRGNSYWIQYDLGYNYDLGFIHYWNYNHPEELGDGIKDIIIDYSSDGNTWTEFGTTIFNQANGSGFYEGEVGVNLDGINARYLLITMTSNHGGTCYALSEIRFGIHKTPCTTQELIVDENPIIDAYYHAAKSIESKGVIGSGSDLDFFAGNQISLNAGFHVSKGGALFVDIVDCN